jgi:hypothetical protein
MGIASCRYVLERESNRRDDRDAVADREPATTDAPTHWSAGAATDPPVDPQIMLVKPEEAPPDVEATYQYLTDALGTPSVKSIFRAFESDPAFLSAVVDAQVDERFEDARLRHELRGLYVKALDADADRGSFKRTLSPKRPGRLWPKNWQCSTIISRRS